MYDQPVKHVHACGFCLQRDAIYLFRSGHQLAKLNDAGDGIDESTARFFTSQEDTGLPLCAQCLPEVLRQNGINNDGAPEREADEDESDDPY